MPAKPRTKSSKPVTSQPFYKRLSVVISAVGALVIIIALPLLWIIALKLFNQSYYSGDKQQISANMSSFLNKVQLDQAPLHQELVDQGCTSNGVGLATWTTCYINGDKFYEGTGDISSHLSTLDALLKQEGWHQVFITPSDQQVLSGTEGGSLTYNQNSVDGNTTNAYATIIVYKDGQSVGDMTVDSLIQAKKIVSPPSGNVIYGVRISENYWSCSNESTLIPCPAPPSTPHL